MGGDVSVQSEYGKGSVFTVFFSQHIADSRPMGNLEHRVFTQTSPDGIKFIAPGFRLLIVDDLQTNLKVAEGLLAPYSMDISTCLSGAEAIDSIRENDFDLVLMDHMMPEMDGVEAVAHIRRLEGKRFKKLPIIALTANAMSGMREMFLQHGFNDYLSKPIETSKLNEIMKRWIPGEKRQQASEEEKNAPQVTDLVIEGLDTRQGLARSGGSVAAYRQVLESYCRDAAERLEILGTVPAPGNLNLFTIHFHALKSASASIGAQALSEELAFLEAAGQRGDLPAVAGRLDNCREDLAGLVERIRAALAAETGGPEEESATPLDKVALLRLKEALEAEKVGLADDILNELAAQPLDPAVKKQLSVISEHILMFEFKEASDEVDVLAHAEDTHK
jgi:CheY-like chemotaxis protein